MKKNNEITKNNLDERQEQTLLKIEHNGFWLAFWGLFAGMLVQTFLFGSDFRVIACELTVLLVMCVYVAAACLKNGIWDRRLKANPKTNLIVSLIAGAVPGALMFLRVYKDHPDKPYGSIAAGVFIFVMIFVLCFVMLSVSARAYKKRVEELEADADSSDE